ncbi:MAG TPA: hypothetical protein VHA76_03490 [Solirubrobacterales bacterium]|nr:hypothetical protein [Solirubrobacterales bacterium]
MSGTPGYPREAESIETFRAVRREAFAAERAAWEAAGEFAREETG